MTLRSPLVLAVLLAGCTGSKPPGQQTAFQCTDASRVALTQYDDAPPPLTGGTLLITRDGRTAVAADPDRDRVSIVDVPSFTLRGELALEPGDEPGRAVEDREGRVHLALRRGGALVTIDPIAVKQLERREVCAAPRGVAYEAPRDLVHVACAGGELISLAASGGRGFVRSLKLDSDLRDVVVHGDLLIVSKFRSAEVLTIDRSGQIAWRARLADFTSPDVRTGELFQAAVAWRMVPFGDSVLVAHQRGTTGVIDTHPKSHDAAGAPEGTIGSPFPTPFPTTNGGAQPGVPMGGPGAVIGPGGSGGPGLPGGGGGGYGSSGPGNFNDCGAIAHSTVSVVSDRQVPTASAPFPAEIVLPLDVAVNPDGHRIAIISAGITASPGAPNVFLLDAASLGGAPFCNSIVTEPFSVDQPVAIAFSGQLMIVQSREPARLTAFDTSPAIGLGGGAGIRSLPLGGLSRSYAGHVRFHANTNGIACASCHPEGGEDGRIWQFDFGARRTQELRGGVANTAPFHWSGDLPTMMDLVNEILTRRMGGDAQSCDNIGAIASWVQTIPLLPKAKPQDSSAVMRGRALFFDSQTLCSTCHTPPQYSNNGTFTVGTGEPFQVPRLLGLADRAPYLHDGRAAALIDRFDPSLGGGEEHGHTAHLSPAQIADLVSFLETL